MDQFNVALDYVRCNSTAMYGEVGGNGLIPDPDCEGIMEIKILGAV
jgi:hypothetical protein